MGGHIVVIEDEADVLDAVRSALEMDGYAVTGIRDPACVPALDHGMDPDLFLIDVMLPRISGIEVARELRKNGYPSTPMLAMSASPLMSDVASAAGIFDDALCKPLQLSILLEAVELYAAPRLESSE